MLKKLDEFEKGETGLIVKVEGVGKLRRRLFDMGVTSGTDVILYKKAPLGDPLEVIIRGYELTLRKTEAHLVTVETKGSEK